MDVCDTTADDFRLSQAIASPRRILNMFKLYRSSLATMAANFNWSEAAEETLIEMWRERPPLFNIELSAYHNRVTKDSLHTKICREIGCNRK